MDKLEGERDALEAEKDAAERALKAKERDEASLRAGMDTMGADLSENILRLKRQLDAEALNVANLSSRKNQAEEHKRKLMK